MIKDKLLRFCVIGSLLALGLSLFMLFRSQYAPSSGLDDVGELMLGLILGAVSLLFSMIGLSYRLVGYLKKARLQPGDNLALLLLLAPGVIFCILVVVFQA